MSGTNDGHRTVISEIAVAPARYTVSQDEAAEFMLRTEGLSEPLRKRIPQIYERSSIKSRHTCLEDYTRSFETFDFYPRTPSLAPAPSTAARNRVYRRESIPLAAKAANECLENSGTNASDITHLIVVSCTGFFAPGLDIHLVKALGLPQNTQRTMIGFMGCYAAFNALRLGDSFCKSASGARVLIVCIELCTLHFQIENSLESVVVNALFSDGCAAVLMQSAEAGQVENALVYRDSQSMLDDDSLSAMSWDVGDTGYLMGLSPKVPELIGRALPGYMDQLLSRNGLTKSTIGFWAVHPGGRQVLDRTAEVLEIDGNQMDDSYSVLREHGNMSSPTILFILKRVLDRQRAGEVMAGNQRFGVALAFGPGLTVEGCLLELSGASSA